ncbi:hypothetical protein OS493_024303 [Desmophyllum pertusum]|uniref:Uncharacterized protein n=1 Tax=Desmophyllum pertusum TaxID=174260 RepID=A0A9W9YY52_9CNID|nr:hypothetical protein OS493_024303 [Desmophyllum pertusum]
MAVISSKVLNEEEFKKEDLERRGKGYKDYLRRCLAADSIEMEHEEGRGKSDNKARRELCLFCKGLHSLETCNQFLKKTIRKETIHTCKRSLSWMSKMGSPS